MIGPQLGQETDAIAVFAYKIIHCSGWLEKWSGQSRTSRTGAAASEYNVLKEVPHVGCDTFAQYIDIPEACTTMHVDSPSPPSNFYY